MTPSERRSVVTVAVFAAAAVLAVVPVVALAQVRSSAADTVAAASTTTLPAAPANGQRVATPLLSSRRVPGLVTGKLVSGPMVDALEALARDVPAGSCFAAELGGVPVAQASPETSVIPASNVKLLTAATALEVLGPDHRARTTVVGAPPDPNGTVTGDLTLVGGGDPLLATDAFLASAPANRAGRQPLPPTSLDDLADRVVAAGVRNVMGGVVGDESRYDAERYPPSWPASYGTTATGGPLSALLVDDGLASFSPPRPTADPAQQAAVTFLRLLRERGVTFGGPARAGVAPPGATELAAIESAPLSEVTRELLATSDNNTAELVLKEIGRAATGGQGTTAGGRAVVDRTLATWGIPLEGVNVVDGSGLSRDNRLTCRALVDLMERYPPGSVLADGLAVAATTGTLVDQFVGNPIAGRLQGKTGSLNGAKALTGVVPVPGEPAVTFALVVNGQGADVRAAQLWDRLGRAIAAFPAAPDLGPYVPLPAVAA